MKYNLSMPDKLILSLLDESIAKDISVEDLIKEILENHVSESTKSPMELLIYKVKVMGVGTTFTLNKVLQKQWGDIEEPRAFGWRAKKILNELGLAERVHIGGGGRTVYKRIG